MPPASPGTLWRTRCSACAMLLLPVSILSTPVVTRARSLDARLGDTAVDRIPDLEHHLVALVLFVGLCMQLAMSLPNLRMGSAARRSSITVNLLWIMSSTYLLAASGQCSSYSMRSVMVGVPASVLLTVSRLVRILTHSLGPPSVARAWLVLDAQQRPDTHLPLGRMVSALLTGAVLRRTTQGLPPTQQLAGICAPEAARIAMTVHAAVKSSGLEWRDAHEQGLHTALAGLGAFASGVYCAAELD